MKHENSFRAWDGEMMIYYEPEWVDFFFKKCDVMKYLGKTDCNGKHICQGDIIAFCKFDDISLKMIGVVEYHSETASFIINCKSKYENMKGEYYFKKDKKYTIVGNIFENPELIEAAN